MAAAPAIRKRINRSRRRTGGFPRTVDATAWHCLEFSSRLPSPSESNPVTLYDPPAIAVRNPSQREPQPPVDREGLRGAEAGWIGQVGRRVG